MLQPNLRILRALLSRFARTPLRAWPLLEFNVVESSLLYMAAFLMSALLGAVLIDPLGPIAVPLAFMISSTVETIALAIVYFGARTQ